MASIGNILIFATAATIAMATAEVATPPRRTLTQLKAARGDRVGRFMDTYYLKEAKSLAKEMFRNSNVKQQHEKNRLRLTRRNAEIDGQLTEIARSFARAYGSANNLHDKLNFEHIYGPASAVAAAVDEAIKPQVRTTLNANRAAGRQKLIGAGTAAATTAPNAHRKQSLASRAPVSIDGTTQALHQVAHRPKLLGRRLHVVHKHTVSSAPKLANLTIVKNLTAKMAITANSSNSTQSSATSKLSTSSSSTSILRKAAEVNNKVGTNQSANASTLSGLLTWLANRTGASKSSNVSKVSNVSKFVNRSKVSKIRKARTSRPKSYNTSTVLSRAANWSEQQLPMSTNRSTSLSRVSEPNVSWAAAWHPTHSAKHAAQSAEDKYSGAKFQSRCVPESARGPSEFWERRRQIGQLSFLQESSVQKRSIRRQRQTEQQRRWAAKSRGGTSLHLDLSMSHREVDHLRSTIKGTAFTSFTRKMKEGIFYTIASINDDVGMSEFIKTMIQEVGGEVVDEGGLQGIVPYYTGSKALQTFSRLMEELAAIAGLSDGWIRMSHLARFKALEMAYGPEFFPGGVGKVATLNEEGYQAVAFTRRSPEMVKFVHRAAAEFGYFVVDSGGLSGLVPFFSGECRTRSFTELIKELHEVSGIPGQWVRFNTSAARQDDHSKMLLIFESLAPTSV